jgi:hypothetical protein
MNANFHHSPTKHNPMDYCAMDGNETELSPAGPPPYSKSETLIHCVVVSTLVVAVCAVERFALPYQWPGWFCIFNAFLVGSFANFLLCRWLTRAEPVAVALSLLFVGSLFEMTLCNLQLVEIFPTEFVPQVKQEPRELGAIFVLFGYLTFALLVPLLVAVFTSLISWISCKRRSTSILGPSLLLTLTFACSVAVSAWQAQPNPQRYYSTLDWKHQQAVDTYFETRQQKVKIHCPSVQGEKRRLDATDPCSLSWTNKISTSATTISIPYSKEGRWSVAYDAAHEAWVVKVKQELVKTYVYTKQGVRTKDVDQAFGWRFGVDHYFWIAIFISNFLGLAGMVGVWYYAKKVRVGMAWFDTLCEGTVTTDIGGRTVLSAFVCGEMHRFQITATVDTGPVLFDPSEISCLDTDSNETLYREPGNLGLVPDIHVITHTKFSFFRRYLERIWLFTFPPVTAMLWSTGFLWWIHISTR